MSFNIANGTIQRADSVGNIEYIVYTPVEALPKAVIQLVHGFNETIERYENCGLIEKLTECGIVVCAITLSGFEKGKRINLGSSFRIEKDISALFTHMRETYRSLPFLLFGHDLGSMLVREYMVSNDFPVDGVILSGTWDSLQKLGGEKLKTKLDVFLHGRDYVGKYTGKAVFGYNTVENAKNDLLGGYNYTCGSYLEFLELLERVSDPVWAEGIPLSLPVLLLSGSDDPIEIEGNGPSCVYTRLFDAELCELKLKKYENCGHLPHFSSCKNDVFCDMCVWIEDVCRGVVDWGTLKI